MDDFDTLLMDNELTPDELRLVEHAKAAIVRYNQIRHANGGIDTLYSFLLSERGNLYDGASFEAHVPYASP